MAPRTATMNSINVAENSQTLKGFIKKLVMSRVSCCVTIARVLTSMINIVKKAMLVTSMSTFESAPGTENWTIQIETPQNTIVIMNIVHWIDSIV